MSNSVNPPNKCSNCTGTLEPIGEIPFRTKGETGLAKIFFGDYAELGEEKIKLDLFRCQTCGHIEMFDLDFSLKKK